MINNHQNLEMYRLKLAILFCVFAQGSFLSAQSPYEVNWKKEVPFASLGVAAIGTGAYLRSQTSSLTASELLQIGEFESSGLDEFATERFSERADKASDVFWFGSHVFPFIFLSGEKTRSEFGKIMVLYSEAASINLGLTVITKSLTGRYRPYVYNPKVSEELKLSRNAKTSFFSGHASMTALNSFFAAKVFSDYYPESKWKPVVWGAAAVIPGITGYLRVEAGKHFPTDVLTGYAVGASLGILIPHLHRNRMFRNENLNMSVGFNSAYLSLKF